MNKITNELLSELEREVKIATILHCAEMLGTCKDMKQVESLRTAMLMSATVSTGSKSKKESISKLKKMFGITLK